MKNVTETFAINLMKELKLRNMSLLRFSELSGISHSFASRCVSTRERNVSLSNAYAMANAINLKLSELIEEVEKPNVTWDLKELLLQNKVQLEGQIINDEGKLKIVKLINLIIDSEFINYEKLGNEIELFKLISDIQKLNFEYGN